MDCKVCKTERGQIVPMRRGLLKRHSGASTALDKQWHEVYLCAVCGSKVYVGEILPGDKDKLKYLKPMDEEVIMATAKELKDRLEACGNDETLRVNTRLRGPQAVLMKRVIKELDCPISELVRLALDDLCEKYGY